MLDLGLDLDLWPWVWLVVAVLFAVVELTVLGGSFMVLPFAASAFVASLLGFSDVSVSVQWTVFVLGGGILFLLFWRYQTLVQRGNILPVGVGAVRLVGSTGVVTRRIDPAHPDVRGEVLIGSETWGALADGPAALPEGTRVRVTDVEGTRVRVEPLGPEEAPPAHPPTAQGPSEGST